MIPLLFGNKKTVEFRLHTATLDIDKIVNYLIICSSVLNFVKDNTSSILKNPSSVLSGLNIRDIIYESNRNESSLFFDSVYEYIQQRKDYIYMCTKNGDIIADENNFKPYKIIKWSGESKTISRRSKKIMYNTFTHSHFNELVDSLNTVNISSEDDIISTQPVLNDDF